MKILKARYDLIRYIFFPFCLISVISYLYFFHVLATISLVNWIFVLFLLGFCVTSISRQRLGSHTETTRSRVKWLGSLFISQFLINLLCWSIFHPSLQFVLLTTAFPMGFTILVALTLGYFTYHQGDLGLFSSAYQPLFKNTHLDSVGVAVDSYMRIIPFTVMACLLALLTIGVANLLHTLFDLPLVSGFKPIIIVVGCVLLLLVSQPTWFRWLHHLMYLRIPTAAILIGCSVILGVVYLLLSAIADKIVLLNPLLNQEYIFPAQEHQLLSMTLLWLSLGALAGGYIANVSQHRSQRELIVGTLGMNALGWIVIFLLAKWYPPLSSATSSLILMMLVSVIFLIILLREANYTYFTRATIPTAEPMKPRSSFRTLKIMPLAMVTICCVYFAVGFAAFNYLLVFGFFPGLILLLIGFVGWGRKMGFYFPHPTLSRKRERDK